MRLTNRDVAFLREYQYNYRTNVDRLYELPAFQDGVEHDIYACLEMIVKIDQLIREGV